MKSYCDQGTGTAEASPGQLLQGKLQFFHGQWIPAFQRQEKEEELQLCSHYRPSPLAPTVPANLQSPPSISSNQLNPIAICTKPDPVPLGHGIHSLPCLLRPSQGSQQMAFSSQSFQDCVGCTDPLTPGSSLLSGQPLWQLIHAEQENLTISLDWVLL